VRNEILHLERGCGIDGPKFDSQQREENILFSKESRPAMAAT